VFVNAILRKFRPAVALAGDKMSPYHYTSLRSQSPQAIRSQQHRHITRGTPVNQAARNVGRTLALVLPVVLVLSGTLAVARVPWGEAPADSAVINAGAERAGYADQTAELDEPLAPQDALRERLLVELYEAGPGTALTTLQYEVEHTPSLAPHCSEIARALGRAAVDKYGSAALAQEHARPVCDTSFAAGIAESH
jgi:hypothetical protein